MGKDYKDKYYVFDIEEYEKTSSNIYNPPTPISDAVVIRLQDTFAPAALWAYANSVATMLDIFEDFGIGTIPVRNEAKGLLSSREMIEELHQVHEYFIAMAVRADEVRRKLPTP